MSLMASECHTQFAVSHLPILSKRNVEWETGKLPKVS
jgi:hypothetical protein